MCVKGHGWWPGRAAPPGADRPSVTSVCVEFFDKTSGWVQRADCLPFKENFDVLHNSKKVPAFLKASRVRQMPVAAYA